VILSFVPLPFLRPLPVNCEKPAIPPALAHEQREQAHEQQDRDQELDDDRLGLLARLLIDRHARAAGREFFEELLSDRAGGRVRRPQALEAVARRRGGDHAFGRDGGGRGGRGQLDAIVVVEHDGALDVAVPGERLHGAERHLRAGAARLDPAKQGRERDRQPDRRQQQEQRQRVTQDQAARVRGEVTEGHQHRVAALSEPRAHRGFARAVGADAIAGRRLWWGWVVCHVRAE